MALAALCVLFLMLILSILASGTISYDLDGDLRCTDDSNGAESLTSGLIDTIPDGDLSDVLKRWYSINLLPPLNPSQDSRSQWPEVCLFGPRWIRYCFQDESSRDNLLDVLLHAIVLWQPAVQQSSLNIQPDLACEGNYDCLCSHVNGRGRAVDGDALVIRVSEIWTCGR